jgi:hypothetical protein
MQDPELLSFIDIECYCWSTVLAEFTPMINAGMVFCDRHYGGINYPKVLAGCCWTCTTPLEHATWCPCAHWTPACICMHTSGRSTPGFATFVS